MGFNRHPHIEERKNQGPVKTSDQLPTGNRVSRFNSALANKITSAVGTMWCAYIFAVIDFLALPQAIRGGMFGLVQWIASFFLQLVLLSIIMVGQNNQAAAADAKNEQHFKDVEANFQDNTIIMQKLEEQEKMITRIHHQVVPVVNDDVVPDSE